jgi:regulatory protein YycI of two-component signal transduction system YycFG
MEAVIAGLTAGLGISVIVVVILIILICISCYYFNKRNKSLLRKVTANVLENRLQKEQVKTLRQDNERFTKAVLTIMRENRRNKQQNIENSNGMPLTHTNLLSEHSIL